MESGAAKLERVMDALQAEALAMLHAINTASQMGCHKVLLETDSAQLKTAVTTEDYDLAVLGAIFTDIKFQLYVDFTDVSVVYCPRACNFVAHYLAKYGANLGAGT